RENDTIVVSFLCYMLEYSNPFASIFQSEICKITDQYIKQFRLESRREFDRECFEEAVRELTLEFRSKGEKARRHLLLDRFFDAFFPSSEHSNTDFFERFAMRPIELFQQEISDAVFNANTQKIDVDSRRMGLAISNVSVRQYGPSGLYHVPPGVFMQKNLEEQDVIVSTDFSSCRAVAGVDINGRAMFSHITTGHKEDQLIEMFRNDFGTGDLYYMYPHESLRPEADEETVAARDARTKEFQERANRFGLIPIFYQEVSGRPFSLNFSDIRGTTISLSKNGIQMIGSDYKSIDAGYGKRRRMHLLREETRMDIPFSS
ncbi:MAG: hypothetical protein UU48_C0015G0022, partial [Candidatus Uhrbacteria bacterium GW2011_GWF2_41_16]